ncbi:restriction endonuclease [Serratia marcescens]|uniref:Restriction endonuclease n=1 Tax=Serratia marcescens TaxID=615 RepID=A0AA46K9W3_SERMA|nr:restriction endonuclease [Serratia marcescens]TQI86300.1 restriction endonuclease [Serratia marcescens]HEJ7120905.1 restriction endonuclease [Serratia marcescens]
MTEIDSRYKLSGSLNPNSLPVLAADILKWSLGHTKVRILDGPGDGRRDILSITPEGIQHLTQCKHHSDDSKSVSSRETDEIVIALAKFGVKSALFFTNGRISPQGKREYIDNFPDYSLDYIDGDLMLQYVEESPLLSRMWLHGSTLGMITQRLLIPFIIRNISDDSTVKLNTTQYEGVANFWGSRELFEPFRPSIKSGGVGDLSANSISGERRLSLTELPIAIANMKQDVLQTLKGSYTGVTVRFGKSALINPKSKNEDDNIWIGGIEPESYIINFNGEIKTEKEWLLPEMGEDWQFPENISVAEVEWAGWFSENHDAFLMYELRWPYVTGSNQSIEIYEHSEREAVNQSLFVAVNDEQLELIRQDLVPQPDWFESLGGKTVLGWLHPYLCHNEKEQQRSVKIEDGKYIPFHPEAEIFFVEAENIRHQLKKMGIDEFEPARAIHLAAALARPLVYTKSYDRAPAVQILEYYDNIPSPSYLLDRSMTYLQMLESVDESVFEVDIDIRTLEAQLPDGLTLKLDVKMGRRTERLFAMVMLTAKSIGPESATHHANRLINLVSNMTPSLKEIIGSIWPGAVLATKRFWRDEVGMFFEDGKFIGRPWVMLMPPENTPDQSPELYIIRPDQLAEKK